LPDRSEYEAHLNRIRDIHSHLVEDATAATKLATDPLGPLPAGMDAAEAAAWTVVANVLLNLDGVLVKG
jgi:hypothetical protein